MSITTRAYDEGRYARRRRWLPHANPYINSAELAFWWMQGWLDPYREARVRNCTTCR